MSTEAFDEAMESTVAHGMVSIELVRSSRALADRISAAQDAGEAPDSPAVLADFAHFAAIWQLQALRTGLGDLVDEVASSSPHRKQPSVPANDSDRQAWRPDKLGSCADDIEFGYLENRLDVAGIVELSRA